jgi:hypothetical protein
LFRKRKGMEQEAVRRKRRMFTTVMKSLRMIQTSSLPASSILRK